VVGGSGGRSRRGRGRRGAAESRTARARASSGVSLGFGGLGFRGRVGRTRISGSRCGGISQSFIALGRYGVQSAACWDGSVLPVGTVDAWRTVRQSWTERAMGPSLSMVQLRGHCAGAGHEAEGGRRPVQPQRVEGRRWSRVFRTRWRKGRSGATALRIPQTSRLSREWVPGVAGAAAEPFVAHGERAGELGDEDCSAASRRWTTVRLRQGLMLEAARAQVVG